MLLIILVFATLALCYQRELWQLAKAKSENLTLKAECLEAGIEPNELEQVESSRHKLRQKESNIKQINQKGASMLQLVNEVEKLLPPQVSLTCLEVTAEKITIKGWAANYGQEARFISNLKKSGLLGDVVSIDTNLIAGQDQLKFELSLERSVGDDVKEK